MNIFLTETLSSVLSGLVLYGLLHLRLRKLSQHLHRQDAHLDSQDASLSKLLNKDDS